MQSRVTGKGGFLQTSSSLPSDLSYKCTYKSPHLHPPLASVATAFEASTSLIIKVRTWECIQNAESQAPAQAN